MKVDVVKGVRAGAVGGVVPDPTLNVLDEPSPAPGLDVECASA